MRLTSDGEQVLFPEPDFEYVLGAIRVNKHFFVGGMRVASSARNWTAPSAASSPLFAWRGPDIPLPPGWVPGAAAAAGVLLLFGLALRPRASGPPLRLRVTSSLLPTTAMPALIAMNCDPQPPPRILGTHFSAVLFYATDHLGSTVVVLDAGRNVRMRRGYQPFGEVGWGEGYELGHQFTGERLDPTGLYTLGPRQYDPTTGRFLQPDPIVPGAENPQALNRYSYVLNRPLELTDPSGLAPESSSSRERPPPIGLGFLSGERGIIGRIPGLEHIGLLFRLLSGEFPRGTSISERRFQSVPPGSEAERTAPPFFNERLVRRIEAKIAELRSDRDERLAELECLTTRGSACFDAPNAGFEILDALIESIEVIDDPLPIPMDGRRTDKRMELLDRIVSPMVVNLRINTVRDEIAIVQRRIRVLEGLVDREKDKRGKRLRR